MSKKPETRTLKISPKQAAMLQTADADRSAAEERFQLVAKAILAGHDLDGGELVTIDTAADPPVLTVKV